MLYQCFTRQLNSSSASKVLSACCSSLSRHQNGIHVKQFENSSSSYIFHISCRHSSENTAGLRKPKLNRGPYSEITNTDINLFKSLINERVLTDPSEIESYNEDWLKTYKGAGKVVLKPKTTEEVSAILSYCNERKLALVPQGGNTGLVGGSIPIFDEIVLSTQLMNKIISLDEVSGALVCQSGCVLEMLDNHAADHDLVVPLDLGAKGSCHIGGNISTNAGGIRLLRYGSLHGNVLGLEVVLANGEIVDCLQTLRKDNTGYDIKQMFIGSEGTLGVVTAASILCHPRSSSVNVALLGCETFASILTILKKTKSELGEILSAFEMMDRASMDMVTSNLGLTNPLTNSPFYVLIETRGSNGAHDEEKITNLLQKLLNDGVTADGTVCTDLTKIKEVWKLRESCAEGLMKDGYCYKYDFSLSLAHFYTLVEVVRERLGSKVTRVVAYGHVGDGNLHLNITTPEFSTEVMTLIEPFMYDWVSQHGGSVSAEHGLGLWKRNYIYHSKTRSAVNVMKSMKTVLDPNGILNPYKVLPADQTVAVVS